jgi:hypothetical protein
MPPQLDTGTPYLYPCTAVRVTEYTPRGSLRHDMALTYRFDHPVTLAYCPVYGTPEDLGTRPMAAAGGPPPSLTAVMAPFNHPERPNIAALAHCLRLYATHGAAVEGWHQLEDGHWLYLLVPLWQVAADVDAWTPREPDAFRIFTAGYALSSRDSYRWPTPAPVPADHQPPQQGTRKYATEHGTPPPPRGFPPRPTTGTTRPAPADDPAPNGLGVRVEYRASVPRHQLGAAITEALDAIAEATAPNREDPQR